MTKRDTKKHLIFGTGLIGGFLAGGLIQQGFNVTLLGRERHEEAMRPGLIVSDLHGNKSELPAPTFWHTGDDTQFDILWLAVKCTAVDSSLDELQKFIAPSTVIICCQNGFGSDTQLRASFPDNIVLTAIVGFNVAEQGNNHLHRSTDGRLVIESHQDLNSIFEAADSALLPVHASHNILAERWAKLQLNLANPVNALSDIPTKAMTEDAGYRRIIVALMRELLAVSKAMKLDLPKLTAAPAKALPMLMSLPNWLYLKIAQRTLAIDPTARVSMWWDLSQGKKSEIEFLNQAVVEQGKLLGIDCPVNQRIVDLIRRVEQGELTIGFNAKQLESELGLNDN